MNNPLPGPGRIPRNQHHGRSLHPRVGRIQRHCYGRPNPTPRQSGVVVPSVTAVWSGGHPEVWTQIRQLSAGYRVATVVHHWMLPRPWRRLEDRGRRRSVQRAPPGIETSGDGIFQRKLSATWGSLDRGGDCGVFGGGRIRRYVGAHSVASSPLV